MINEDSEPMRAFADFCRDMLFAPRVAQRDRTADGDELTVVDTWQLGG